MSEVKVNKISPRSGTAITLGDSGDTFTIPSGATLAIAGSVTGFTSAGIDDNATSVAITIDSSERVGIGTTSPANTLDVNDSAGAVIKITRDSQSSYLQLSTDGSSGQVFSGAGDLKFKTGSSEAARIDTSGNFGIGVSSPSRKLQVVQDSTSAGGIYLYSNAVHTGTGTNALLAVRSDSNNGSNNGDVVNIQGDGVGNLLVLNNNGTSRLQIKADGTIGTGSSSGTLVIQGGSTYPGAKIQMAGGQASSNPGTIIFSTDDGTVSNPSERARIDASGNFGIGTTAPQNTLHVLKSAISGASYRTNAPLILENNSNTEIQILSANSSDGQLRFGDADANFRGAITYSHSDDSFTIATNGASQVKIHSNGVMSAADGIALGVGTANTASNVLNDYEEGTWSPAFTGDGGGASGVSFNDRVGTYVKIGESVTVHIFIGLASWSSGPSGNIKIGTLPFAANSLSSYRAAGSIGYVNNFSQAPGGCLVTAGSNVISLRKRNSTSAMDNLTNNVTASDMSGDEQIIISMTYQV